MADVKTPEKQETKDHVYAIVHKDNTGRKCAASVHTRTPCSERLEPASRSCSAVEPVNRSFSADPANRSDARPNTVELVYHSQEALVGDEKKDYLYAVVDKANKKKRPPQVNITGMLFFAGFSVLFLVFCLFFFFFFFLLLLFFVCLFCFVLFLISFDNIDQRFLLY